MAIARRKGERDLENYRRVWGFWRRRGSVAERELEWGRTNSIDAPSVGSSDPSELVFSISLLLFHFHQTRIWKPAYFHSSVDFFIFYFFAFCLTIAIRSKTTRFGWLARGKNHLPTDVKNMFNHLVNLLNARMYTWIYSVYIYFLSLTNI